MDMSRSDPKNLDHILLVDLCIKFTLHTRDRKLCQIGDYLRVQNLQSLQELAYYNAGMSGECFRVLPVCSSHSKRSVSGGAGTLAYILPSAIRGPDET